MIKQRRKLNSQFKNRRNPQLYSRTQTVKKERSKGGFLKILYLLLLTLFVYVLFLSPAFKLGELVYAGDELKKESITKNYNQFKAKGFNSNILFFNRDKFLEEITQDKSIKDIKIKKDYLKKVITIEVTSQTPKFVWNVRTEKFLVDETGLVFKKMGEPEEGSKNLININYKLIDEVTVGSKALSENIFNFTKIISDNFENKLSNKIVSIDFDYSVNEFTVYTDANYKIYFDTKRNAESQLESVLMVKKEAEKKKKKLDYIDLRVESRVFYKFR